MIVQFRNHYRCGECENEWIDDYESQPDDRCPECNTSTSPHYSEDVGTVAELKGWDK
jgi:rubrerythrin